MRALSFALVALLVLIQYPLWLGQRGWLKVWDLDRKVSAQQLHNVQLAARNEALAADVRDLKAGFEAIEERARFELGLVKKDEVFFQYIDAGGSSPTR